MYAGAIELPLRCAQDWDVTRAGYDHWQAGCPSNDPRVNAYNLRLRCYDLVLETLQAFDTLQTATSGSEAPDELEVISQAAYRIAIGSQDPVFHSHLYDWLIKRGAAEELLEVRPL